MKTKKILRLMIVLCICLGLFMVVGSGESGVYAQDTKQAKPRKETRKLQEGLQLKGQRKAGARGEEKDPNIKQELGDIDLTKTPEAPPEKGGNKRGNQAACEVIIDNYTGWYVQVYVDGSYRGTVAPWGDATYYTTAGETVVYARTPTLSDGSFIYWGPSTYRYCGGNTYIYRELYP